MKSNLTCNIDDFFELLKSKKIILYGAGKIGKSLLFTLKELDINIIEIWDKNHHLYGELEDVKVKKPYSELLLDKKEYIIIVTIFSQNIAEEISISLKKENFTYIISERYLINRILYTRCSNLLKKNLFKFNLNECHMCPVSKDIKNRCDIYDNHVKKELTLSHGSNNIVIPSMGILVSNKCNLKCIGCNQLRDNYTSDSYLDISADEVLSDLNKLSKAVNLIEKVVIVGGEPFLHKDIYRILEEVLDIQNIGIIQIITNGIIIPSDKIFQILSHKKIKLEISNYNDFLSLKQKNKIEIFIKSLKKFNVNFDEVKTLQWFDFGDFNFRKYTKQEWTKTYDTCCFISNDLFNGELHKCARSAFSKHLDIVEKLEYVDIRNTSIKDLPNKIQKFLDLELPMICQYCNGTSSLTIPAGQQKIKND